MDKVFVTRYALTKGIIECRVRKVENSLISVEWSGGLNGHALFYGKDWHRTLPEAQADAERRRQAKIASARRAIERLEAIQIQVTQR